MKQGNIIVFGLFLLVLFLSLNVYAVDCVGELIASCGLYGGNQTGCEASFVLNGSEYRQCIYDGGLCYNDTTQVCGYTGTTTTTTTTLTTTTTSSTTTTSTTVVPYHPGGYGNFGQLWIFTILFPVFALILTIASIAFKHPLLSFLAALFWFASSLTTSNIIFVGEFGYDTTYTALGNPEWNQLYNGLGVVMILYTIGLIVNIAYGSGRIGVKRDRGRD